MQRLLYYFDCKVLRFVTDERIIYLTFVMQSLKVSKIKNQAKFYSFQVRNFVRDSHTEGKFE